MEAVTSFAELAERYSLRPELVANLDLCQCARARESALAEGGDTGPLPSLDRADFVGEVTIVAYVSKF